jgi:hypothetical protein
MDASRPAGEALRPDHGLHRARLIAVRRSKRLSISKAEDRTDFHISTIYMKYRDLIPDKWIYRNPYYSVSVAIISLFLWDIIQIEPMVAIIGHKSSNIG